MVKNKTNDIVQHVLKRVVILGAGFCGVQCAKRLAKKLSDFEIVLIDQRDVHIYSPDLYEIATAFSEKINPVCLTKLKDTVAIPLRDIVPPRVQRIVSKVRAIHSEKISVELQDGRIIEASHIVVALGSVTNYRNIPGLEDHSLALKSMHDGLGITCAIDHYFQRIWEQNINKQIRIVIGGGGATGVEFACELPGYIKRLCQKYHYPYGAVHIMLLEGQSHLLDGDRIASRIVEARLQTLDIQVRLNSRITRVTHTDLFFQQNGDEKKMPADIVIWTGGVAPNPLIADSFRHVGKGGGVLVNEYLQTIDNPHIFSGGDNAHTVDSSTGALSPLLAQLAFEQGKLIADNIVAHIRHKRMRRYHFRLKGCIVPLGGMYALWRVGAHAFHGKLCWILRRLIDLRYALSILPFGKAFRKFLHDTNVFLAND